MAGDWHLKSLICQSLETLDLKKNVLNEPAFNLFSQIFLCLLHASGFVSAVLCILNRVCICLRMADKIMPAANKASPSDCRIFLTSLSVSWRDKQSVMIFRRKASLYWSLVWLTAPKPGSHFSEFVTLTACGKIWTAVLTSCGHYSTGRAFATQHMGQNPVRGSSSRVQTGCSRVCLDEPATNEYAGLIKAHF